MPAFDFDANPAYLDALHSYAREHGRNWKESLRLDWYNARAIGERGALLHALRNSPAFGHDGLRAFTLPPGFAFDAPRRKRG